MGGNGSGRPVKEFDVEAMLDMVEGMGLPHSETAEVLGISVPTLRSRIADIEKKQGVLLQYRSLQSLQLTELQARVLEAITPEKINEAPFKDLVAAFKILKEKELTIDGKPSEIKGLIAHLVYIEKQKAAAENGKAPVEDTALLEAEYDDIDHSTSLGSVDTQQF